MTISLSEGNMSFFLSSISTRNQDIIGREEMMMVPENLKETDVKLQWAISRFEIFIADINQIMTRQGEISEGFKRSIIMPSGVMVSFKGTTQKATANNLIVAWDMDGQIAFHNFKVQFSDEDLLIFAETIKQELKLIQNSHQNQQGLPKGTIPLVDSHQLHKQHTVKMHLLIELLIEDMHIVNFQIFSLEIYVIMITI